MSADGPHHPIGSRFTPAFRDLDVRRLPTAPPRPGAVNGKENTQGDSVNKTESVLAVLQGDARRQEDAMSAHEISDQLKGVVDPGTVSALLRTRLLAGRTPQLRTAKAARGRVVWWWSVTDADSPPPVIAEEECMQKESNDAQPPRGLVADVPEMPPLTKVEPASSLLSELDQMTADAVHGVADRETKVMVLTRLAAVALPRVAAVLRRIVDEDLPARKIDAG